MLDEHRWIVLLLSVSLSAGWLILRGWKKLGPRKRSSAQRDLAQLAPRKKNGRGSVKPLNFQDSPREYDRFLVELEEQSRTIRAEIDTKIRYLEQMVHAADASTMRLETLLARLEHLQKKVEPMSYQRAVEEVFGGSPSRRAAATSTASSRHNEIYQLADAGLDVDAIAKQVKKTAGEVSLVLRLRAAEAPQA